MKTVTRKNDHEDESKRWMRNYGVKKKTHDKQPETWRDVMQDRQMTRP